MLSVKLQSIILRPLDNDEYALVLILNRSSAFHFVNIKLVIKIVEKIGMSRDIIELIQLRLENISYYVSRDRQISYLFDLRLGTVQGLILGPILYAISVSTL